MCVYLHVPQFVRVSFSPLRLLSLFAGLQAVFLSVSVTVVVPVVVPVVVAEAKAPLSSCPVAGGTNSIQLN